MATNTAEESENAPKGWRRWKDEITVGLSAVGAVGVIVTTVLGMHGCNPRHSETSIRFLDAHDSVRVTATNSGRRPSTITGMRLQFEPWLPLEDAELQPAASNVVAGQADATLEYTVAGIARKVEYHTIVEELDKYPAGLVTLFVDVQESNEKKPTRKAMRVPISELRKFILKYTPEK